MKKNYEKNENSRRIRNGKIRAAEKKARSFPVELSGLTDEDIKFLKAHVNISEKRAMEEK